MTTVEILIAKLDRVAATSADPKVAKAAKAQADGYRAAWAAKQAKASK